MRVLVTGGTGFVGSHTAAALVRGGHDVRLLVRDPARVEPALGPLGTATSDVVTGDVTDRSSLATAVAGCDAVIHAASVYTLDPRRAREMRAINAAGTRNIIDAAAEAGLDPIVHVSSLVALIPGVEPTIGPDAPVTGRIGPYARSKATSERLARRYQDRGLPVVSVMPGSVWGPNDPHFGESHQIAANFIRGRLPLLNRGGQLPIVDVRDLAEAIARSVERGRGPRRYLLAGTATSSVDIARRTERLTGRSVRHIALPDAVVRASAPALDLMQRLSPWRLPLAGETSRFVAQPLHEFDNSRAESELGFSMRPLDETVADTIRYLAQTGRISKAQAGLLG